MIGKTKSAGFQVGVRKTFPVSADKAWEIITSKEGYAVWLEITDILYFQKGVELTTKTGVEIKVGVVNPGVNLRLALKPQGWIKPSTIQVRVIGDGQKVTIAFHQENLPGEEEREQMKKKWSQALADLAKLIEKKN